MATVTAFVPVIPFTAGQSVDPGELPAVVGYTIFRWGWLDWLLP